MLSINYRVWQAEQTKLPMLTRTGDVSGKGHIAPTTSSHKRDTSGVLETALQIIVGTASQITAREEQAPAVFGEHRRQHPCPLIRCVKGTKRQLQAAEPASGHTCQEDDPRKEEQDGRRPEQACEQEKVTSAPFSPRSLGSRHHRLRCTIRHLQTLQTVLHAWQDTT